ncbi:hypothetical protein CMI37_33890 [Candidatus Pacearchaeota archaeon]|nr:hypothetical protein [Candidatus Pacearchaeota archaeon]
MAYKFSKGKRELGDIEFEGDPDETQIDFEDDFIATAISGKTSDYTLTGGDHTILVDCSSGNVTLTLPTAVGCAGRMYVIKRIDATNNAANINSDGSEEIEGSTNPASVTAMSSIMIQSDNSGWWKIAEYILPP